MSAFEEMKNSGQVGRETVDLFISNVPSIAKRHSFPPPDSAPAWTRDVCEKWVVEFFEKKGNEAAVKLITRATDEASFTLLVRRAIENEMKDQAKATEVGKLRSRMRTLLAKDSDFLDATQLLGGDHAWTFSEHGETVFGGDWEDLLTAPELKAIEPIQELNHSGPTSRENAAKLVGAARIILRKAGGALRDQVLARALMKLFELDAPDMFFLRDSDAAGARSATTPTSTPEEVVDGIAAGDAIIFQLSPDQCMAMVVLDQPIAIAEKFLSHLTDVPTFLEDLKTRLRDVIDPHNLPAGAYDHVIAWGLKLWEER